MNSNYRQKRNTLKWYAFFLSMPNTLIVEGCRYCKMKYQLCFYLCRSLIYLHKSNFSKCRVTLGRTRHFSKKKHGKRGELWRRFQQVSKFSCRARFVQSPSTKISKETTWFVELSPSGGYVGEMSRTAGNCWTDECKKLLVIAGGKNSKGEVANQLKASKNSLHLAIFQRWRTRLNALLVNHPMSAAASFNSFWTFVEAT